MNYEIWGETMPAVTLTMEPGEAIYTQSGGMTWMTDSFQMDTNMKGGLCAGLGRMFSGESLFLATYRCTRPGGQITFASTLPGQIIAFRINPSYSIIAQKGAFLCATMNVKVSNYYNGFSGGFFGGEGFIMQQFSGEGLVFAEMDGCIREYTLAPGEVLKVDTGNVAAFEHTVGYSVSRVRGFKNILFGGEGLFLTTLTGPGKVWLQTMTISNIAYRLMPYMPSPRGDD